ncbi:MAG: hypothetical protein U0842_14085 [Candidatus Binatia bacterium]
MRALLSLTLLLALASSAAAGTKYKVNLVPTPADCFGGLGICLNNGNSCNDPEQNSDCTAPGLSPKSTVSIDGKMRLQVSLKEVRDPTGGLVTTGPAGAADTYVLDVSLHGCVVDAGEIPYCGGAASGSTHLYVKVPLVGGRTNTKVDLHGVTVGGNPIAAAGDTLRIEQVSLLRPQPFCPGTNSASDISARLTGFTCNDGVQVVAVNGVVVE